MAVTVSSRVVPSEGLAGDQLSSLFIWLLAGLSSAWAVGLSFSRTDSLRVPSVPCHVGFSNMAACVIRPCKCEGNRRRMSAPWKPQSFIMEAWESQPSMFAVLGALETSHSVQPALKGRRSHKGVNTTRRDSPGSHVCTSQKWTW